MIKLNDSGAGTAAPLMAALFFSLIFSSVCIAYFVTEMGVSDCSLNSKTCIVPTIAIPNQIGSYAQTQNFVTEEFDKNIWGSKEGTFDNEAGKGISGEGYLVIDNLQFNNDIITNTYVINNSAKADYGIIVVYTGGYDSDIIKVSSDGFRIQGSMDWFTNPKEFIPYAYANQFTHPTITTTYNRKLHTVDFSLNSASFHSAQMNEHEDLLETTGVFSRWYGGIATNSAGFALEQFTTSNPIQTTSENTEGGLAGILSFMTTAILILTWTLPESIFPFVLNVLLIKTQIVAMTICFVQFIRGG